MYDEATGSTVAGSSTTTANLKATESSRSGILLSTGYVSEAAALAGFNYTYTIHKPADTEEEEEKEEPPVQTNKDTTSC